MIYNSSTLQDGNIVSIPIYMDVEMVEYIWLCHEHHLSTNQHDWIP